MPRATTKTKTKKSYSKKAKSNKPKIDKYELVTNKLIALIESGVNPWAKPWHSKGYGNLITGKEYQGINPFLCGVDCLINDWNSPYFLSFNQAKENGWKIIKGSKSTWIKWATPIVKEKEDKDTGELSASTYYACKWYGVFNIECIDDSESDKKIADFIAKLPQVTNNEPRIQQAEELIKAQNVTTEFGGNRACYSPSQDKISMPYYTDFRSAKSYYGTHLHELIHATGHPSRLNRSLKGNFGSSDYAYEELIAEIGAAMTCNDLFIDYELYHHASYLNGWLNVLKQDKKAFFNAADAARKASKFLTDNLEN